MFTFQWPWLAILLPVPFLIRLLSPPKKEVPRVSVPELLFPHLQRLQLAFGETSVRQGPRSRLLLWLLIPAWMLLVLALMRPQIVDRVQPMQNAGHDLMLAVDLSGSMRSLDMGGMTERLSRLDVAKNVVRDFVKKRQGDRIGLVMFGQYAYLQSPLTFDTQAVSKLLDNSVSGMAGDATAIGDAIGIAVKNLREKPGKAKAIILLTDGEDNASTIPPLQAAQLAKQYGIRIYTIVIGTEGVVPFPDENGQIVMVESHVDTELTQKIAEVTGGEFYTASDETGLEGIYNHINALEKTKGDQRWFLIRKPLYPYPLAAALLLLATLGILSQVRRDSYDLASV